MIDLPNITVGESDASKSSLKENGLPYEDVKVSELSGEYIGRWTNLVSTTNWEKGRIICQWREALIGSECSTEAYSDEAWSRTVGGVSPQHVGRLRRVFERFGDCYSSYPSLYWSHFLAALDWDDAEMWLEGASQCQWSVSQMRATRVESLGVDSGDDMNTLQDPDATDDEDFVPLSEIDSSTASEREREYIEQSGPRYDDPDFGDCDSTDANNELQSTEDDLAPWEDLPCKSDGVESPFANLPSLPSDIAEALEQFKLAIIRHRASGWVEVSLADILRTLEALRLFANQTA